MTELPPNLITKNVEAQVKYPLPTFITHGCDNDPDHFSNERCALHDKIIDQCFAKAEKARDDIEDARKRYMAKMATAAKHKHAKSPKNISIPEHAVTPEQPVLLVIAGGPGSGKSVLTKWMRQQKILGGEFATVSSETFAALPEFADVVTDAGHPHPEKSSTLLREYYALRERFLERAIPKGMSLVIDDHFDHADRDRELIARAKAAGYLTVLVGITMRPYPYFDKVLLTDKYSRKENAHHEWVLQRHADFPKNWEQLSDQFHYSFLYQNMYQRGKLEHAPICLISARQSMYNPRTLYEDKKRLDLFKQWREVDTSAHHLDKAFASRQDENYDTFCTRLGRDAGGGHLSGAHAETDNGLGKKGFIERLTKLSRETIRDDEYLMGLS